MHMPMKKVKYFAWHERYDFLFLYDLDFAYGQSLIGVESASYMMVPSANIKKRYN
jgi:hypothetical protein